MAPSSAKTPEPHTQPSRFPYFRFTLMCFLVFTGLLWIGEGVTAYLAGDHPSLKATADGLLDAAKVFSGVAAGLFTGKALS